MPKLLPVSKSDIKVTFWRHALDLEASSAIGGMLNFEVWRHALDLEASSAIRCMRTSISDF